MTKDELLASIRRDRARLGALVASVPRERLTEPVLEGGWSVKDHMSHIAAWERMIVAHLQDGSDARVAGMDSESYAAATLDELNDHLYRRHRDAAVERVRDEFRAAHEAIVAYIELMPEDRLPAVYWNDDPSARTVLEKIAGDTYLHYREHTGWIGELIARKAAEAR